MNESVHACKCVCACEHLCAWERVCEFYIFWHKCKPWLYDEFWCQTITEKLAAPWTLSVLQKHVLVQRHGFSGHPISANAIVWVYMCAWVNFHEGHKYIPDSISNVQMARLTDGPMDRRKNEQTHGQKCYNPSKIRGWYWVVHINWQIYLFWYLFF